METRTQTARDGARLSLKTSKLAATAAYISDTLQDLEFIAKPTRNVTTETGNGSGYCVDRQSKNFGHDRRNDTRPCVCLPNGSKSKDAEVCGRQVARPEQKILLLEAHVIELESKLKALSRPASDIRTKIDQKPTALLDLSTKPILETETKNHEHNHSVDARANNVQIDIDNKKEVEEMIKENNVLREENKRLKLSENQLKSMEIEILQTRKDITLEKRDQENIEILQMKVEKYCSGTDKEDLPLSNVGGIYSGILALLRNMHVHLKPGELILFLDGLCYSLHELSDKFMQLTSNLDDSHSQAESIKLKALQVSEEATITIDRMANEYISFYKDKDQRSKSQIKVLSQNYAILNAKNKELIKSEASLKREINSLIAQNKRCAMLDQDQINKSNFIDLEAELHQRESKSLKGHIDHLDSTVKGWQSENTELQACLKKYKVEAQTREVEESKLVNQLVLIDQEYQDEKLKNVKALALIKSLHIDIDNRNLASSSDVDAARQNTLKMDEKNDELSSLEIKLHDNIEKNRKLGEEYAKIKAKSAQSKDKFQVREGRWLESLRVSTQDHEKSIKLNQDLTAYLQSYSDQYAAIQAVVDANCPISTTHPLSFTNIFGNLHVQTQESYKKHESLQSILKQSQEQFEETVKELKHSSLQLGIERDKNKCMTDTAILSESVLQAKIRELEAGLDVAQKARSVANDKLRLIINKTVAYVGLI